MGVRTIQIEQNLRFEKVWKEYTEDIYS